MEEELQKTTGGKFFSKKPIYIVALIATVLTIGIGIGIFNSEANRLQRYLDLGQKYLDELEYDDISSCEEGVAYAVKDGELYIISK